MTLLYALLIVNAIALAIVARQIAPIARVNALAAARARMRESCVGFGPTVIAPTSTMVFSTPIRQDWFQGRRLIVPASIGSSFTINDIVAAGEHALEDTTSGIPAAVFSESAMGVDLKMKKVAAGETILLSVSNTSKEPAPFTASIIGLVPSDVAHVPMNARPETA